MSAINDKFAAQSVGNTRKVNQRGYAQEDVTDILFSYLNMRRILGFIAILLPVILLVSSLCWNHETLPSISAYYYTGMRTVFTGFIFAIAFFLSTYQGEDRIETILSFSAAICVLGVALLPTFSSVQYSILDKNSDGETLIYTLSDFTGFIIPTVPCSKIIGDLHYAFAAAFFILLIILVLWKFVAFEKNLENRSWVLKFYRFCGYGMLICILFIFLSMVTEFMPSFPLTFIGESIALVLFGSTWLVKGEVNKIELPKLSDT